MAEDPRIEQFKQMSEADPENELGHFSLGKVYLETGQFGDAIAPLSRVLELKPMMSKAYQLLGEAYDGAGQREKAIEVVTRGITIADDQGDRMPRDAMADTLRKWSAPVPSFKEVAKPEPAGAAGTSSEGFKCSRCERPDGQLAKAPFKGALGGKVYANVCHQCWREWIAMGTKVINELGLVLSTEAGQKAYDQYMEEFLQLEEV